MNKKIFFLFHIFFLFLGHCASEPAEVISETEASAAVQFTENDVEEYTASMIETASPPFAHLQCEFLIVVEGARVPEIGFSVTQN